MPGSDMGPTAAYKNPESVKKNLLQPVVERLRILLRQPVDLVIEKDKTTAGVIHASMFAEAERAPVYIADLTGANPNVYLELGVRWGLRDAVTIPIAQNVADLRFNVISNRAILYNPDNLLDAIEAIVAAVVAGLSKDSCDSPVRLNSTLVTISRAELQSLHDEILQLKTARGEELVRAAKAEPDVSRRVQLLEQAIEVNPAYVEALLLVGGAYRATSRYDDAVAAFESSLRLEPNNASAKRELGVTYSKMGNLDLAVETLRSAVRLDDRDAEAWSNLGGALRRVGMRNAPVDYDAGALKESRYSYKTAHDINTYDIYSGLNVARLDVLLSRWQYDLTDQAAAEFSRELNLCRVAVTDAPDDFWRQFDLAEALLFVGSYDEAKRVWRRAIDLVPGPERRDRLSSVLSPLMAYLDAGVVTGPTKSAVEMFVADLRTATDATT
jgi:tetratricopeptide (TPR) repeat protein